MTEPRQPHTWLEKIEAFETELMHGLLGRLRLAGLLKRYPARLVWAGFMFLNGFITIALLSGLAMLSGTPLIFPSLGPTAFLFFANPTDASSSPRNALCGHAIGILCGYAALWLVGLQDAPSAMLEGVGWRRVLAAAFSLAATGALMILFRAGHPPAGATTLIVSLGLVTHPFQLLMIEAAVALMTLQAFCINRFAGIDYPIWAKRTSTPPAGGQ
jgi:CBS domain-containing membrane protein